MFSKEELTKLLDKSGVEYSMDSETPGIQYSDGRFEFYADVQSPGEYFEALNEASMRLKFISRLDKANKVSPSYQSPSFTSTEDMERYGEISFRMELSA